MKRSILTILGAAGLLTAGCSSTPPVTLAPVGPNPIGFAAASGDGQLQVFSAQSGRDEGENPTWYRHTDYDIYNQDGKRLEHVHNGVGYYSQAPRVVTLPAGEYIVMARACDIMQVRVPVVIKPSETTSIHLDGKWRPLMNTPGAQVVTAPSGYPVGWSAGAQ